VETDAQPHRSPEPITSAFARARTAAHAGAVMLSGEPGYANAMGRLISAEASLAHPVCIVQPKDGAQVATAVKMARDSGCPVTVRGGSHSSLCAGDQAVMIDLSAHSGR
jgi:FAD/FMN-containing dehydrogenase